MRQKISARRIVVNFSTVNNNHISGDPDIFPANQHATFECHDIFGPEGMGIVRSGTQEFPLDLTDTEWLEINRVLNAALERSSRTAGIEFVALPEHIPTRLPPPTRRG